MCELLVRESFLVQISTYYNYQKAMYIDSSFSIFNALCLLCVIDVFNCVCVCTILVTIRLHFQTSAYLIWARALDTQCLNQKIPFLSTPTTMMLTLNAYSSVLYSQDKAGSSGSSAHNA